MHAKTRPMPNTRSKFNPYHSRSFLLTRNELAFFHALHAMIESRFCLFTKVRLADIVGCSDAHWDREPGRKIAQKHVDFVLCERASSRIVLVIELDDRSHNRPERKVRDLFINQLFRDADIPLLRHRAQGSYQPSALKEFLSSKRRPVWQKEKRKTPSRNSFSNRRGSRRSRRSV